MKNSILLIIAASIYSSFCWAEVYEDHSNPNLQLCKDFKAYLERNVDKPLQCGLVADEQFKDFRLPKLQLAPEGLGLRINVQARMVMSDSYQKHLDEAIRLDKGKRYRITRLDFNNDGNTESVLVEDYPDKCLQAPRYFAAYSSYVYDAKHLNIDSSFISSHKSYANQSGEPFFYDGRVYSAMITNTNSYIYEPRGFREEKLISTRAICSYKKMEN
ncbi:hypothetical protein [Shewanella frigidimarina]|uniref:hypothetical protein n=1 Tax=Shewanella frigidimarina TaxID=56812 RepID=UPI003D7C1122